MDCTLCGKPMQPATSTGRVKVPIWECRACNVVLERKVALLQAALTQDGDIRFEKAKTGKPTRRDNPEHRMQVALFRRVKEHRDAYPVLQLVYAVPNGGFRHPSVAKEMEEEGVTPGIPDIAIDAARRGYHGARIEMKAPGNYPTRRQRDIHKLLEAEDYRVTVQRSVFGAWKEIVWYLGLPTELAESR